MTLITSEVNKEALRKSYEEACKNVEFKKLVKYLNLKDEIAMKYTSSLENTARLFAESGVEVVDLSNFNLDKMYDAGYTSGHFDNEHSIMIARQNQMFKDATKLHTLLVSENFERFDGHQMFEGCTSFLDL